VSGDGLLSLKVFGTVRARSVPGPKGGQVSLFHVINKYLMLLVLAGCTALWPPGSHGQATRNQAESLAGVKAGPVDLSAQARLAALEYLQAPTLEKIGFLAAPSRPTLQCLTDFLARGTSDHFFIAKRIHDWLNESIACDDDLFSTIGVEGSRQTYEVLR